MREQIDSIIQWWAEHYCVEFSSDAGDVLAKLVEEKFTSTNSAMVPCSHCGSKGEHKAIATVYRCNNCNVKFDAQHQ